MLLAGSTRRGWGGAKKAIRKGTQQSELLSAFEKITERENYAFVATEYFARTSFCLSTAASEFTA